MISPKEVVMRRIPRPLVLSAVLGLQVLGLGVSPADAQTIKIGNLVDLTGPTSDQGKDIAQGRNDAVQYINEKGGVNGRKLELISVEYGFQPPRAVAAYKKFVEDDKVLLVLAYINTNTQWVPVVLKDSYKLGLKVKYVVNNYGIDERTPALAREAAEGVYGIQDVAYWGENVPGMKTLMDWHAKHHPNDTHASPYMRGWLWTLMAAEAIKRAGPNPTGEGVKKALETLREWDTWGITPPFTYTNEDHRPTNRARLVVIKDGKVVPVKEVSVERDMKWIGK